MFQNSAASEGCPLDVLGQAAQVFAPAFGDKVVVFDADAADAREVDTWLDGVHMPWLDDLALDHVAQARVLVDIKAKPVSKAVTKAVAIPAVTDVIAGNKIDFLGGNAWA